MPVSLEKEPTLRAPRARAAYWFASLALAGILLYFSLRGIEWSRVWGIVREARLSGVVLAIAVMSLGLFIRAMRWRILLSARAKVPVSTAFWATAAGYLGNSVLPARAGEVVRTVMISAQSGMGKAFVLTTALSERVADAIALITISAVVMLTLDERPGWIAEASRPFAILGICGVVGIALVPIFESFWLRVVARLPLPAGLRSKLEHVLRQVLEGIRSFHSRSRLARFLALTAVIWFLDATVTVIGARAIGLTVHYPLAFLLVAGLGLGSALPSTPGYVGIYQFVAVSVLTPFGLSPAAAIAYILLFQAMNYVVVVSWGLIGLAQQRRAPGLRKTA